MRYRLSFLNAIAGLFLIGLIIYTLFNYAGLATDEGWGVVGMFGLFGIGLALLAVDFILQRILRDRFLLNVCGPLVAIIVVVLLLK